MFTKKVKEYADRNEGRDRVLGLPENKIYQRPPGWIIPNMHYECLMGSYAYGCAEEGKSDLDIYGWCIPQKEVIFPHLAGYINGFGRKPIDFEQYHSTANHIGDGREVDLTIYSIVKFFQLCMENNPNMVDALFVPLNCVTHITGIGSLVRDNRKMFLHKGSYHKFKGYAYSQLHKCKSQTREGKRKETVEKYGYDVKFAYHIIRLLDECEQILSTGDVQLGRNREELKAIRRGEWPLTRVETVFTNREAHLEELYQRSALPYGPDEQAIRRLLLQCLEYHYGNLERAVSETGVAEQKLAEIKRILEG